MIEKHFIRRHRRRGRRCVGRCDEGDSQRTSTRPVDLSKHFFSFCFVELCSKASAIKSIHSAVRAKIRKFTSCFDLVASLRITLYVVHVCVHALRELARSRSFLFIFVSNSMC